MITPRVGLWWYIKTNPYIKEEKNNNNNDSFSGGKKELIFNMKNRRNYNRSSILRGPELEMHLKKWKSSKPRFVTSIRSRNQCDHMLIYMQPPTLKDWSRNPSHINLYGKLTSFWWETETFKCKLNYISSKWKNLTWPQIVNDWHAIANTWTASNIKTCHCCLPVYPNQMPGWKIVSFWKQSKII